MAVRVGWILTILLQAGLVAGETVQPNAPPPKPQFSPTPPNTPLPKPEFMGTPMDVRSAVPNRPRNVWQTNLALPPGTSNVAFDKPVTASDTKPTVGTLSQITASEKVRTKLGYVEIGPGKQYFQIDLQDTYRIQSIVVWHYYRRPRVYRDVVVQLSDKPGFTSNVQTVFNNDNDNSLGFGIGADAQYVETREGLTIDAKGASARFVRLYSNGNTDNDRNHLIAVDVFGTK